MARARRLLIAIALTAVATTATVSPASAVATYHVDPDGSDQAAGTAGAPWKTLQHAVDSVEAGDTIVVHPGTYAGMRIEASGEPGAWIRLTVAKQNTVVIDRPGPQNVHDSNVELENWEGTVAYWIVEGLEVTGAPNWGIDTRGAPDAPAHHIRIRRNHVHHNGLTSVKTGIFFAFTDRATVERNNSHHNGEHGVYLSNSGDHFTVAGNRLHDNRRCGLHMNGDESQGGDGVISFGTIEDNWIEGNGPEGCAGINMDGVTDALVRNNVIVENHASGIAIFRQDGAVCSRDIEVVNNTIVQAADGRWDIVVGAGCRDLTIRNNVLLTRHDWRGAISLPTAGIVGLDSDYNVVSSRFSVDDGNTRVTLAQWRNLTGQDVHSDAASIAATLVAASYRNRVDGPAQDGGTPTSAADDYAGVRRPTGAAWDIGAWETPLCAGQLATLAGTAATDDLRGTAGDDVIVGLGGADTISGRSGDDLVCGGGGADEITGGTGADALRGNGQSDVIHGNGGDDALLGGAQPDTLIGGPGDDLANGGAGADTCTQAETRVSC
jgi:parallel beta-helix repeat protein